MSDNRRRRHKSAQKVGRNDRDSGANLNNPNRKSASTQSLNFRPNMHRTSSYEKVREKVEQEGKNARNLVTWIVPCRDGMSNGPTQARKMSKSAPSKSFIHGSSNSMQKTPDSVFKDLKLVPNCDNDSPRTSSRSNSTSRPFMRKEKDFRARYWKHLFDNLKRAVDEIYYTCEQDESILECKEVIMMLEQCTRDFRSLIDRFQVIEAYENADENNKPHFVAWEIRKSSPAKPFARGSPSPTQRMTPNAQRKLTFNYPPPTSSVHLSGSTWADRVKNIHKEEVRVEVEEDMLVDDNADGLEYTEHVEEYMEHMEHVERVERVPNSVPRENDEEDDGWETVHNRKKKSNSPGSKGSNEHLDSIKPKSGDNGYHSQHHSNRLESAKASGETQQGRNVRRTGQKGPAAKQPERGAPTAKALRTVVERNVKKEDLKQYPQQQRPQSQPQAQSQPRSQPRSQAQQSQLLLQLQPPPQKSSPTQLQPQPQPQSPLQLQVEHQEDDVSGMPNEVKASSSSIKDQVSDGEENLEAEILKQFEQADSLADELVREQEKALQNAQLEEDELKKQIEEEENAQMMEAEGDSEKSPWLTSSQQTIDWDQVKLQFESGQNSVSWADMVDVEETEGRTPGRGCAMHEKLSSPSRKRSPTERRRRDEEKHAKAQEKREKLKEEKTARVRELAKRVEEVRDYKEELMKQRKDILDSKMQRAEDKRKLVLQIKIKKAADEEQKANEIAFITSMEAQIRKHDFLQRQQGHVVRMHNIEEERHKKLEEQKAKETAAEERRKVREAERKARLQEMQEKRRQREAKYEQSQMEKERERSEMAKAKEREREERRAALAAQHQTAVEELQKKIMIKQEESTKRHESQLDEIRRKAFEMSILRHSSEENSDTPTPVPYDTNKFCTLCKVVIQSEVYLSSHLRGKKHLQSLHEIDKDKLLTHDEIESLNLKLIIDLPNEQREIENQSTKERKQAMRKRAKKLRLRMAARGSEFEAKMSEKVTTESPNKIRLVKTIRDIAKYLQSAETGPWPDNRVLALDRAMNDIGRIMERKVTADQLVFRTAGGFATLFDVLRVVENFNGTGEPVIPRRTLAGCVNVVRLCCRNHYDNCHYLLFSNRICCIIDSLVHTMNLTIPDSMCMRSPEDRLPHDALLSSLLQLLATILGCLAKNNPGSTSSEESAERTAKSGDIFQNRANDLIGYMICNGILDKLTIYFNNVRGSLEKEPEAAELIQHGMNLLTSMAKFLARRRSSVFEQQAMDDPTQLIHSLEVTKLAGTISLAYGLLLQSGSSVDRAQGCKPPQLLVCSSSTILSIFKLINHLSVLHLTLVQSVLGSEGISLEFRHICSYLIWYCSHWPSDELLHEVILSVGYLAVKNADNQNIVHSGKAPTILQQLCALPFPYFSDPKLYIILYPTLIACCYGNDANLEVLKQDMSPQLLANFIEDGVADNAATSTQPTKKKNQESVDQRMAFISRFPVDIWNEAIGYFQ